MLYSSVLTGGLLLVNGVGVTPAYATACGTAANFANSTQCIGGNDAAGLVYVADNPLYAAGDFTLLLDTHTVTGAAGENGITFSGVTAGDDGTVIVRNTSTVTSGTGASGIVSTAANAGTTTLISIETGSTVTGANSGIVATATGGGPIEIRTQAGTTVTGNSGHGISGLGSAAGNVTINAQGAATGTTGDGIRAETVNGVASVTTGAGAINGTDNGIEANATGTGSALVTTGTGAVTSTNGDGIFANGDSATVDVHGNVTSTNLSGVSAQADNGNASVTTAAGTTVTGGGVALAAGIFANATGATGDAIVNAGGTVSAGTYGIYASSANGTANVTTGAGPVTGNNGEGIVAAGNSAIVAAGGNVSGATNGIFANGDSGTVNVTTAANTTVSGTGGAGITATATGAVTVDPDGNVNGSTIGINAVSNTNGTVNVVTFAGTTVSGAAGDGINAETTGGANAGNVVVNAQSIVTGAGAGSAGIDANAVGGTVNVTTGAAGVSAAAFGIDATASGAVTVGTGGNVLGTNGIGINAVAQNGNVNVTTNGVVGTQVSGFTGAGIVANANVTGNVDVEVHTIVSGSTIGIDANATAGTVEVTTDTLAVIGNNGNGIEATASGNVTVITGGNISGFNGTGINAASSAAGNIIVTTNNAGNTEVFGTNGNGIGASTTGAGIITITNNVDTAGSNAGIAALSGGGAIQITNNAGASISNTSGDDAFLAISAGGGPVTITNNNGASITGRVLTGALADTFNNNFLWFTEGISDFGAGADVLNNAGGIVAANEQFTAEATVLANLENLNNSNLIFLTDQLAGDPNISDSLTTSGNYNGSGDAALGVDAYLSGPGSLSDQLIIGGNISGVTEIQVRDIDVGPGALNLTGILVVDGNAAGTADATNFVLNGGPIEKGLFVYDLAFDDANNDYLLVGLPGQGVFETLAAVASSQEIWRDTADAWSTRQENLRDLLASSYGVTAVADPPVEGSTAPMGSLWVSALGSWTERDDEESFSAFNLNLDFDLSYSQDIYGVVGGADFATDVGTDSRLLFGVMAGYVDSNLDFDDSDTSIDTDGATVGAYAALLSNGFFATVLVKADLLDMDYSAAGDSDNADVTSWGARGDFGFRFGDAGLFLEPMLSIDGISTKIDEFEIAGTEIDAGTNESFRGSAGLRAGFGDETFRASATARVWDVFSTDNEVDIPGLTVSDDDLEGVYGDVSAQVDVSLSTNATVYVKGGVLFSDDVTKPNASGGFALYW